MSDVPDLFHQSEGFVALVFGVDADDHAAVIVGNQQGSGVLIEEFLRDGLIDGIGIRNHGRDLGEALNFFGKGVFCGGTAVGYQQNIRISLAENRFNGGGIVAGFGAFAENMRGAVIIVIGIGGDKAGNRQNQHEAGKGNHPTGNSFPQLAEVGQEGTVHELLGMFFRGDQKPRGEEKNGNQADADPFGQSQTEIGTDAEAHDGQRQKTDHHRDGTGKNGGAGPA